MSLDVQDHMESQPYGCFCSECRGDLEVTYSKVDSDYDLTIEVAPCEDCLEKAREEGRAERE